VSARPLTRLDLVVNIRFPGSRAHGIQVAAMAEALADTGLAVDVVVPRRLPWRDIDPWVHYGVRRVFGVQRVSSLDTIDLFPPRLQRLPFLVQSASFGWRALARAAVQRDTGILVRDHYTLATLAGGLRERDVQRLAAEVHDLPHSPARRRTLARHLARLPAVVTITRGLRDDLVELGVPAEVVLVAPDGVHVARHADLPDAPAARRHLQLPEAPTVAYAGQFYAWKGVDALVEAVGRVPEAQLLLVGGDKVNLPRVQALARREAPGRVHFTGQVPHAAVPFHLAAADVVALPNSAREEISARYTSPLKLFEALASRRPVLASNLASLREVLRHDQNAWLVPPDDPEALAAGLRALLRDPLRAARLAASARAQADGYDWSERGRAVAQFLRERLVVGAAA
jgi:glycosyltransferase involved in cell wall biosynthesis